MNMGRIYLVDGVPVVSGVLDSLWAVEEGNGWRVYAGIGQASRARASRFVKADVAEDAIRRAGNPFGDLATAGWRKES